MKPCAGKEEEAALTWVEVLVMSLVIAVLILMVLPEAEPETLLAGDRNVTNGVIPVGHVLVLRTNRPVGWTKEMHQHAGNVALGDGSVQQFTSTRLREQLRAARMPHQSIAVP